MDPTTTITYATDRRDPVDVRLLHFNDVYHLDASSAEPVGGVSRFMTVVNEYRQGRQLHPSTEDNKTVDLVTVFSGDVFNPSLESTVTKGAHMVPILNNIGTDVAAAGNHDFDFGVRQFTHLTNECNFPWLLANVLDPALGVDVPLGGAKRTHMLTTSNGIRIGFIGLGEREWLETINSLPPNLIYRSASETAKELVPQLRAQGAELIVCVSHQREPNDVKLAANTEGLIDIILGGHDHYYAYSLIGPPERQTHVLRSGTDFKQLSYLEARRSRQYPGRWDFDIVRRDMHSSIREDPTTAALVDELTSSFRQSLEKPIGWTAAPLDGRFLTVRQQESNLANFVCDILRDYHHADCAMVVGGTFRGDQVYPPGVIRAKDIVSCFPFEDPAILVRATGQAIWDALENGVSLHPALEGRFVQVSNMCYTFDPSKPPHQRIVKASIGGEPIDLARKYLLATRGYMGRGKDGFESLLVQSEGGEVEELVDEENGILISAMLRQYFMGLRTVGQWKNLGEYWKEAGITSPTTLAKDIDHTVTGTASVRSPTSGAWAEWMEKRASISLTPEDEEDEDALMTPQSAHSREDSPRRQLHRQQLREVDTEMLLMRKFFGKWVRLAGIRVPEVGDVETEAALGVDWTRVIAPRLEGRIVML